MQIKPTLRRAAELGIGLSAIATLILAGCGGGGSASQTPVTPSAATSSATITPFKGPYAQGATVKLRDANGAQIATATIGADGKATVTFPQAAVYPLSVEVTGQYWNEVTGATEPSTAPLRGLISTAAVTNVPVTIVTEAAVVDLETKLGGVSMNAPHTTISAASAVAALSVMGTNFGVAASAMPTFNATTHTSTDPDTIRLAAFAVVANSGVTASGTLADKVKLLASNMANLPPTSTPSSLIPQATMAAAMSAAASSVTAVGTTPAVVTAPTISTATVQTTQTAAASTATQQVTAVSAGSTAISSFVNDARATGLVWWNGWATPGNTASGVAAAGGGNASITTLTATGTAGTYIGTAVHKSVTLPGAWTVSSNVGAVSGVTQTHYILSSGGWVVEPTSQTIVDNGTSLSYTGGTLTVVRTDLAGQAVVCGSPAGSDPVGSNSNGNGMTVAAGTCAVASTYPAGSALYTETDIQAADAYYLYDQTGPGVTGNVLTDGAGTPLTALPAVSTTFCVNGSVLVPITGAAAGADNYKMLFAWNPTTGASCAAADIATALLAPAGVGGQTALVAAKATGIAGVTVGVMKVSWSNPTTGQTSSYTQILAFHLGKWMTGYMQPAGANIWYEVNKAAADAQLIANGLPTWP